MRLKKFVRDLLTIAKSNYFKSLNKSSVFSKESILFDKIVISNSKVGSYTYFAGKGNVNNALIGSYCSIADGVKIGLGLHPLDWISTHPATYSNNTIFPYRHFSRRNIFIESKPVIIGNDVWLGANVIIMDGVTIGDGVVIAAGSIVTKDVASYVVAAGVPAKIIKHRVEPKSINGKKWWELDSIALKVYLNGVE
ncbi:CatB-related O-acetyltransferase [Shewanella baltica]|uniref:CatB-related O-acetyltransferase n=1 Tax=Shewanella baltica TaxID=62322 RepID=UPI00216AA32C|nr:CatB-related O-acetyltransferase [Shewanella baltica]MCS6113305.1 CatB-related O-acetyltransferase [Shewanella baltica]UVW64709.1 CatB-related O-acetyltransferase [Shewanella baltica]